VRTKLVMAEGQRRTFGIAVWIGRSVGWALLLVAILGIAQAQLLPSVMSNFELLPSLALGLVAVIWISVLELFLRFFDRYLSGN
jgi:hypothetical protein